MKRPQTKSASPTSVSKAVRLPGHPLSARLLKVLKAVDEVHSPANLKPVSAVIDPRVRGGLFYVYAEAGPYEIHLNPEGSHPELSLFHEVGHFLEWQCIVKSSAGRRDFNSDAVFGEWLDAVLVSANVQRIIMLRDNQAEGSKAWAELSYLLRPEELWARAYSQYITKKSGSMVLAQQIAAENKVTVNGIMSSPYWSHSDFVLIERAMDVIFHNQGWVK